MEKKVAENSDKEEKKNAGEHPRSPSSGSDPKGPDDAKPDNHDNDNDTKAKEETKDKSPPTAAIGKVSSEMDSWLMTLPEQNPDFKEIPDCVDKFLDIVEENMTRYDACEGKARFGEVPEEDSMILESVNRISKLVKLLSQSKLQSQETNERKDSVSNRIGVIRQGAMSYLEEEFRLLMEEPRNRHRNQGSETESCVYDPKKKHGDQNHSQKADPEAEKADSDFPGYSEETIVSLNKIVREMIFGGYESECCQVYVISRRQALDERLQKLGFEKISIDEIQKMHWDSLEREIPTWITTFKQCADSYFLGELNLVERVFKEHPGIGSGIFSNLTRGVVIQLLNFAEGVAMTKRSAEKLFKFLDMCDTLGVVISALERLFPEERGGELKAETTSAKSRLGEAAISIFGDLESSIKSETGKAAVPGGAVHPLTRYVMNYLPYACEYKETLEQVFKEHAGNENDNKEESPFAAQVVRLMELLDASLEGKARLYKDPSLGCIFMMNNGRYILQKIKGSSEILQVLGNTWCRKKSSDLRTYHKNYQRETWSKILGCLSPEGLTVNGKVQKPLVKERFKSFNTMFDEIHKTQSSWIVSDEQLQSELRVSITSLVTPAYRGFLGRFSQSLASGRQTEKYVKYQPEDIETYIEDLFGGNPQFMSRRKLI